LVRLLSAQAIAAALCRHIVSLENDMAGSITKQTAAWVNTTITLFTPDPNYSKTLGKASGVTGSIKTTDGGKTWTVDTIQIPQHKFNA